MSECIISLREKPIDGGADGDMLERDDDDGGAIDEEEGSCDGTLGALDDCGRYVDDGDDDDGGGGCGGGGCGDDDEGGGYLGG
jgi:hypothetical protein